jgi:hypothetical protein
MKIILHENFNPLSGYFQEDDFNIPFLGSTLLDFFVSSINRFAEICNGEEVSFFAPFGWGLNVFDRNAGLVSLLSGAHEIFIIGDLFNIPIYDFSKEHYHFLIQNPGKLFSLKSGLKIGYMSNSSDFSKIHTDEVDIFSNVVRLNQTNFLRVNQTLVARVSSANKNIPGNYGNPFIAASESNIKNSKICGPCFIGEDVLIINSVIYPGSVLTGKTTVVNSEIFESFVCESDVKNSVIKNSLIALSKINQVNLKDSVSPRGSILEHERER